jgi:uncharacterized membrane protein
MNILVERSIDIEAPPDVVWRVMSDVEKWPEWTASMRRIERIGDGPLAKGSSARVAARGGPPAVWTVTELEKGRSFKWEAKTSGTLAVANHVVEPAGEGSRVTLTLTINGGLALALMSPLVSAIARRNVRQEAEGLKVRSEELAKSPEQGQTA